MSLTSHLDEKSSPVREFFVNQFPNTGFKQFRNLPLGNSEGANISKVEVWDAGAARVLPDEQKGYPWPTVGTAFDYRLRYLFEATPVEKLVASGGALRLSQHFQGSELPGFQQLQFELSKVTPHLGPAVLSGSQEQHLNRLCYVLALYEQCFRSRIQPIWQIVELGPTATLEDLMALCRNDVSDDMAAMAKLFCDNQYDLFGIRPLLLNPKFAASTLLGGADADLIVGHILIDIKTAKEAKAERPELWQLAGYVLADLDDRYGITEVGFYFSRHGSRITWPVGEFLDQLAGRHIDLVKTRQEFGTLLEGLNR